ncbi:phosphate starvation-inducible protein PsiF [Hylemonella gracilis str. Niagara R]|uniref:Phosphate starvation-inducible protein PsiF n=1 Tax=Hylemonella gracilis str. Niagara R TaxID=1458275 RepID=A0A016XDX6_9BURK|nr:phosphate starvation-inducible protein PsiF [Hylemonella gracilis str. Niagara R]
MKYAHWAFQLSLALGLAVGLSYVWAAAPTQAATNPQTGAAAKPTKPAAVAQAQPGKEAEKKHTQQERMKNCNAEAKSKTLKGDERKTFMSQCLSNKPEAQGAKK